MNLLFIRVSGNNLFLNWFFMFFDWNFFDFDPCPFLNWKLLVFDLLNKNLIFRAFCTVILYVFNCSIFGFTIYFLYSSTPNKCYDFENLSISFFIQKPQNFNFFFIQSRRICLTTSAKNITPCPRSSATSPPFLCSPSPPSSIAITYVINMYSLVVKLPIQNSALITGGIWAAFAKA